MIIVYEVVNGISLCVVFNAVVVGEIDGLAVVAVIFEVFVISIDGEFVGQDKNLLKKVGF